IRKHIIEPVLLADTDTGPALISAGPFFEVGRISLSGIFICLHPGNRAGYLCFLAGPVYQQGNNLLIGWKYLEICSKETTQVTAVFPITVILLPAVGYVTIYSVPPITVNSCHPP